MLKVSPQLRWYHKNKTKIKHRRKAYMKEYRRKNRKEINARNKKWRGANMRKILFNIQSSYESFLKHLLKGLKKTDKRLNRTFMLTINEVMNKLKKQHYLCAITDMKMDHKFRSLKAVSIDRKDSRKGHTSDNIQLVCRFINLGKGNHYDQDVHAFLRELSRSYRRRIHETR